MSGEEVNKGASAGETVIYWCWQDAIAASRKVAEARVRPCLWAAQKKSFVEKISDQAHCNVQRRLTRLLIHDLQNSIV